MHTNKTTYYELPQFVGSDIVNDLTDTNGAYSAIDSAIHEVAENVATETTDIAAIKAQNGDAVLTTTAQTLSGAINELDDDINNASTGLASRVTLAEADIATAEGQIGSLATDLSSTQTAVATNTSAIGTLNNSVGSLNTDVSALDTRLDTVEATVGDSNSGLVKDVNDLKQINKVLASVTGDGVKTVTQLLTDLWNAVKDNLADIPREAVVVINQSGSEDIFKITSVQSGVIIATCSYYSESSNWVATYDIRISATPTYKRVGVSDSAFNVFDYALTVYTDTTSISIVV